MSDEAHKDRDVGSELRQSLQDASCARRAAKLEYQQLYSRLKELCPDHPEAAMALARAEENGREALNRYSEALRIFSDFALRRKVPRKP